MLILKILKLLEVNGFKNSIVKITLEMIIASQEMSK